jgi:Fe-S-cluster containining protein
VPPRVRPLLVRAGARFACAGDGLCCADAHLLGPVSAPEARALRAAHPGSIVRDQGLAVIRTQEDGTCGFLTQAGRCRIHTSPLKPRTCHRYPFLLTATPEGGRIATDHRCPCRSMGPRPPLRAEDAEAALRDASGRLAADVRIGARVPLDPGRALTWAAWRERESEMLARLDAGEPPERVLEASPFPALRAGSWRGVGADLADDEGVRRWERANQWAGDALLALHGASPRARRPRPWADAFDRAEARSPEPEDPEAMLADWIADALWSLEWTTRGDLALARADLATRVVIARWIGARLESEGVRADRARAEGISVAEIVALSDTWSELMAGAVSPA